LVSGSPTTAGSLSRLHRSIVEVGQIGTLGAAERMTST